MEELPNTGSDQNIHQFFTQLIQDRDTRIKVLEQQLQSQKASAAHSDWEDRYEKLHQEHKQTKHEFQVEVNGFKSRINGLNSTIAQLRADTQPAPNHPFTIGQVHGTSRIEYGLGFLGLLLGLAAGIYGGIWFQKRLGPPKTDQMRAFELIQKKHQFNFEYEISQGRYGAIDSVLRAEIVDASNLQIKPELEFLHQVLKATRKRMTDEHVPTSEAGFATLPDDKIHATTKYKGSLTVTEPTLAVRAEASASSEKLGTLVKDDVVKIVDKSHRLEKLTTRYEGKKAEIEDVWYKIEMKNGMEGWVYGHYTSASRNAMTIFADDGTTTAAKPAAEAPKDSIKLIVPAKKAE